MDIRPEQIEHPATPENFVGLKGIWHAGFETGFLGNPKITGFSDDKVQATADAGFAAGTAARAEYDKRPKTEKEAAA
jgi:hypothetical protein